MDSHLPQCIVDQIMFMLPLEPGLGKGSWNWNYSHDGNIKVKTKHKYLIENMDQSEESIRKAI